jgi:hypothetical protein
MRKVLVVTTLLLLMLCVFCLPGFHQTALGEDKSPRRSKPILVITGADSRLDQPGYHRITSEEAWQKLWLSHLGKTEADTFQEHLPILQIDFETCMVIAIFKGSATNSRGLNVSSVEGNQDNVLLRFDDMSYQTSGGLGGGGGKVEVRPYAFVLIPKYAKLVVVEENVQSLKDRPPAWKECARLKDEDARE